MSLSFSSSLPNSPPYLLFYFTLERCSFSLIHLVHTLTWLKISWPGEGKPPRAAATPERCLTDTTARMRIPAWMEAPLECSASGFFTQTAGLRGVSAAAPAHLEHPCSFAQLHGVPLYGCIFFLIHLVSPAAFALSLKMQRKIKIR